MPVPIVVCSRNRLECLKRQMECFDRRGWGGDVTILDMSSDWPPLLEWYGTCGRRVVTLPNEGPHHFWRTEEFERVKGGYYVYTDSDVVLADTCPLDVMDMCRSVLERARGTGFGKVGLTLRTGDIPLSFPFRDKVDVGEGLVNSMPHVGAGVRVSLVDTTFAMYAPGVGFGDASPRPWVSLCLALRADPPYEAVHLPWYADFEDMSEEDRHYYGTARVDEASTMAGWVRERGLLREGRGG